MSVLVSAPSLSSPVSAHVNPDVILLVASDVAAVRVGSLGIVAAKAAPDLPPGDKIVAYALPRTAHAVRFPAGQAAQLTALDVQGRPLPGVPIRPGFGSAPTNWTTHAGACAVAATAPGLVDLQSYTARSIKALPGSSPGLFRSCLEDKYGLGRARFNVAILFNAHDPGQPPAALWNTTPVPDHPGIFEIRPPTQFPLNQDVTAPLYARRVHAAWLVVQARPGFTPSATVAQRIRILDSLRITRFDINP
jgi:hypothetical protein